MVGRTLGHYRVVEKLGEGGMGEVYLAEDTTLKRQVALKVLPTAVTSSPERLERFQREAESLAALNHPNIVTVFSVEDDDGVHFLTMELVEGESLDQVIPSEGLPLEQFFDLAIPLADALSEAHEQGIIHRDLKPANIMVDRKGRPKILDFGLAKLRQPESAVGLSQLTTDVMTQEGRVLGTYPYMSPEQVEGKVVDHHSDLFSFGTVLYEMAVGQRPFQGDSPASLMSSILRDAPPEVDLRRQDLPHHLSRILGRCLAKDPDDRYQQARNLKQDLEKLREEVQTGVRVVPSLPSGPPFKRRWVRIAALGALALLVAAVALFVTKPWAALEQQGPGPGPRINSLAVLPLKNLSGDPEQDYYAAGITDGLIADLGRIAALRVISRQSVMRYQDSDKSLPEIANELGVEALIEGSVLPVGDRVRVTAQLVQANPEKHLWADTYERDAKDILTLLSEVTRSITSEVRVAVSPQEEARLAGTSEVDPEAHRAFLKGMYFLDQFTPSGATKSEEYFRKSIELDPTFAPAWAGLAVNYSNKEFWLLPWEEEARARAAVEGEAALRRALELDDSISSAHTLRAQIYALRKWDWQKAEIEYRRAIELGPSDSAAHLWYAYFLSAMGRHEEALLEASLAEELDPLSPRVLQIVGNIHRNAREFEQAMDYYGKALEITPNNPWLIVEKLWAYGAQARSDEYVETARELRTLLARDPTNPERQQKHQWLADSFEGMTMIEVNRLWLREANDPSSPLYGETGPTTIAMCHAMNGESEQALEWLEKTYSQRDDLGRQVRSHLMFLKVDPIWDGLRSDPRFQELLRRVNFSG